MEIKATVNEKAGTTPVAEWNYEDLEHGHIPPANLFLLRIICEISVGSPLLFSHEILHFSCQIPFLPSLANIFLRIIERRKGEKTWSFGEREAEYEDRAERTASYVPATLLNFYIWVIPNK